MEVRGEGAAGVATEGEGVSLTEREGPARGDVEGMGFLAVLFFEDPGREGAMELLEVGVDRGDAFGGTEVEGLAVAVWADLDAFDDAVGCGEDWEALAPLGFEVEAGVEVVGPELAEISCKNERNGERAGDSGARRAATSELRSGVGGGRGGGLGGEVWPEREEQNQEQAGGARGLQQESVEKENQHVCPQKYLPYFCKD